MVGLITAGVVAAVGLLLAVVLRTLYLKRNAVAIKLDDYSLDKRPLAASNKIEKVKETQNVREVLSRFAPQHLVAKYTPVLQQAGIPLRGEEMAGAIGLSTLLGAVLGLLLFSVPGLLLLGVAGYLLPGQILKVYLARRLRAAEEQLEDFLTFSANAMRAGNSLLQALDLAGRDLRDPISTEMKRTLREINLGLSVDEALQRLVTRLPSQDMDLVVTAVTIQRQVGGDLAGILDNIATTIRERQHMKAQVRTLTAQGRLSGIVIAGLPFGLLLLFRVMNPDYISLLWREPLGLVMLGFGIVSQAIGMILINKVVKIDI